MIVFYICLGCTAFTFIYQSRPVFFLFQQNSGDSISSNKCYRIIGPIYDTEVYTENFDKVIVGFKLIGFRDADINEIFKIIAAVILLGELGMISHKMSLITIFGHKHFRQKFHQKIYIFHEKILVHIWN